VKGDLRLEKGERTKAVILKEARRLIAERGFTGTSVKDITDAAGVPKSLFYHYFEGVDSLLKEIIDSGSILKRAGAGAEARKKARIDSVSDAARNDDRAKDAYVARVFSAMSAGADDLRILLGEALRGKEAMDTLFETLISISADLDAAMPEELEKGYSAKELAALRIYTRIFPVILLALTEDKAARRLKLGKTALRELVFSGLRSPLAPKEASHENTSAQWKP
jgi:AcrR family transcriptional regulator